MVHELMRPRSSLILLPLGALAMAFFLWGANAGERVVIPIELSDPVHPAKPKRSHELVLQKDDRGFPAGYAMSLTSEVCLDEVCKVVEVTLHWDPLGFCRRLDFPEGKPLTKREHKPFEDRDYRKLDEILRDRDSLLRQKPLEQLGGEDPDDGGENGYGEGLSRATPPAVKEAVVRDAAWTTWVLWRYANTEIVPLLRETTWAHRSPDYVEHLLDSGNWDAIEFALTNLLAGGDTPSAHISRVSRALPRAEFAQLELALHYIRRASRDEGVFHGHLIEILPTLEASGAARVVEELAGAKELPEEVLVALTTKLDRLPFYPLHRSLTLLEDRSVSSEEAVRNVTRLLESEDSLVARRAAKFLSGRNLPPDSRARLDAYLRGE